MNRCSETVDIEDLVLGTIDETRARRLRVHLESCVPCQHEERLVAAQRALFVRREAALPPPPPAFDEQLRLRLASEPRRARPSVTGTWVGPARRGLVRLVRRARGVSSLAQHHGHVPLAFAAAVFCLVGMSRLGGAPVLPAGDEAAVADPGALASLLPPSSPELLACRDPGVAPSLVSSMPATQDTKVTLASEHLACGRDVAHEFCAAP